MAITFDGKVYRNLEEQVQANKNNIERIIEGEELLARLGIKVVGQVATVEELPNPTTYQGEYGDAYLVGAETPYDYYIFTRPFTGEVDPQWFNLGPFPVAGPQGPMGPAGPRGENGVRGSQWFSGTGQPTTTSGYNVGDYYINVGTGNIWHLHEVDGAQRWLLEGNIRGPQGVQGIPGPAGPAGPRGEQGSTGPQGVPGSPVIIRGVVTDLDQLPDVYQIQDYSDAYLYDHNGVMNLIVAITDHDGSMMWYNSGLFSGGTQVLVNGVPVPTYNAQNDIYIHKIEGVLGSTGASIAYSVIIYLPTQDNIINNNTIGSDEYAKLFAYSLVPRYVDIAGQRTILMGRNCVGSTSYFRYPTGFNANGTMTYGELTVYSNQYKVTTYNVTKLT